MLEPSAAAMKAAASPASGHEGEASGFAAQTTGLAR